MISSHRRGKPLTNFPSFNPEQTNPISTKTGGRLI